MKDTFQGMVMNGYEWAALSMDHSLSDLKAYCPKQGYPFDCPIRRCSILK